MISNYLFALAMGLLAIVILYLDSLQTKTKLTRIKYIKLFIGASLISLITSSFYNVSITSNQSMPGVNFSNTIKRQEILTGNPDF